MKSLKNIHVLLTDKPSRLCINGKNQMHIYITFDEEIKVDDDWYYNTVTNAIFQIKYLTEYNPEQDKKIILTTDQDLISDGVQDIDDEFLQWFVKNPSCEFVKVEKCSLLNTSRTYLDIDKYKIIIPKKKPKQETK